MSRMERAGDVIRLSRGVYQLTDVELDPNHCLAQASKRIPKGVICLISALALHGLTDQLPAKTWIAIGTKDWAPKQDGTPIRIVRFTDKLLSEGVETHTIEGVSVRVFEPAKTVADCFRHRSKERKATPAEITRQADKGGVSTVIRPYLEALISNG